MAKRRQKDNQKNELIMLAFAAVIIILVSAFVLLGSASNESRLNLVAREKTSVVASPSLDAAVGWSDNTDYYAAISEAVGEAKAKLNGKQPNFAYVVYISEENHDPIISEVRKQIGPGVKIYGHTSNTIITNDALIQDKTFAIGVLLVASKDITFGMGTVDQDAYKIPEEAGRTAIRKAIEDAGKTPAEKPEMVLYMGTALRGGENQILDGIASAIGKDVPVIGGNAKDFGPKFKNNWRQFTHNETFSTGLMIVSIYTNKKIGWGFEATFGLTDKKGIVTKSDGFRIAEINSRPALEVYNEWVDGEFYKRLNAGEFNSKEDVVDFALVKIFTLLNPIAKIVRGEGGQIGHFATSPIPDSQDIKNKTLTVYAQVSTGDEISLYQGTWQTVMNRVETIPNDALLRSGLNKNEGTFAIMAFCNGLKTVLPKEEFMKVPSITNDVLGVPFLGAVTAGEQGPLPGIRNVNANLIESVVLVG